MLERTNAQTMRKWAYLNKPFKDDGTEEMARIMYKNAKEIFNIQGCKKTPDRKKTEKNILSYTNFIS